MSLLTTASLIVTPNAYKTSKLYSVVPSDGSGDMVFTRSTTATRVNSAGLIETVAINIPRIDYTDGGCPSILVEPQRTNLAKNSQVFNTAFWNKDLTTVVDNSVTSPDGTINAATLTETAGTGSHHIHETVGSFAPTISSSYTMSCFVKLPTTAAGRFVQLPFFIAGFGVNAYANFDLLNGVVGTLGSAITSASIKSYTNGWYRISASAPATATGLSGFQLSLITSASAVRTESYTVTAGNEKSILMWGTQLELGGLETSYIPTTASTVTRNIDILGKTSATALIGQTEGTIFLDFNRTRIQEGLKSLVQIYSNNATALINLFTPNNVLTTFTVQIIVGGSTYSRTINLLDGRNKIAVVYNTTQTKIFLNGVEQSPIANVGIPVMDKIEIAHRVQTRQYGYVKTFALWKTQVSGEDCIQLTTL